MWKPSLVPENEQGVSLCANWHGPALARIARRVPRRRPPWRACCTMGSWLERNLTNQPTVGWSKPDIDQFCRVHPYSDPWTTQICLRFRWFWPCLWILIRICQSQEGVFWNKNFIIVRGVTVERHVLSVRSFLVRNNNISRQLACTKGLQTFDSVFLVSPLQGVLNSWISLGKR